MAQDGNPASGTSQINDPQSLSRFFYRQLVGSLLHSEKPFSAIRQLVAAWKNDRVGVRSRLTYRSASPLIAIQL